MILTQGVCAGCKRSFIGYQGKKSYVLAFVPPFGEVTMEVCEACAERINAIPQGYSMGTGGLEAVAAEQEKP